LVNDSITGDIFLIITVRQQFLVYWHRIWFMCWEQNLAKHDC
jgi:hypothetical protein